MKAMTKDYDAELDPWLYVDASAAIGVAQRNGLGKIRHLDTQSLWLQEAVRKKRIGLEKVKGTENPTDLMTKFTDLATLDKLCALMGLEVKGGRAAAAPNETKKPRRDSGPRQRGGGCRGSIFGERGRVRRV